MANLPLFTLITLTTLVALSSAYQTTTITTTTLPDYTTSAIEKCDTPTPAENLEKCVVYLTQGIVSNNHQNLLQMVVARSLLQESPILECCREIGVATSYACKCNAVQTAFDEARAKAGNIIEVRQILTRAQVLSPYCRLGPSCPIVSPRA